MQSARQKLREYCDEDHRSHDEIVELWTNILSKCDLTTLVSYRFLNKENDEDITPNSSPTRNLKGLCRLVGFYKIRSDSISDSFTWEDILDLKTQSSEKILREAFAHLLIPFIEKLKQEFVKKNEEQTNSKQYDFLKSYNKYNLRQLKTEVSIEKKSVLLINDVISDFAEQSKISRSDFMDLLVDKSC
ncbi:unnamed protein product [Rotaria socialis]|uniref:Uncharacterized protein n=1 Tax=Rotaria socialis TaxID=392032 RepID=A0A818WY15_9BILA|nr:unnamed protein product [Rotaria socialis]